MLMAGNAFADVKEEERFEFKLDKGGRISLENINGDVSVVGGKGKMVEVVAYKQAGTQEYLDAIEIHVKATDEVIFIETEHPSSNKKSKWGRNSSGSVSYVLTVPASVSLDSVETVNGDVEISGVSGDVSAATVNGDVEASDLQADASLETVNGSLDAFFVTFDGAQKAELETVNGRTTVSLPADADFSVKAESVMGGINVDDFNLKVEKGFVGRSLDGEVGGGSARLSLDTVNGSIRIRSH
jgi:DUF4097 and DUF4098 domain-containing protein YvlB